METPERLLRMPDVVALCGMRRASIYDAMRRGDFPQPIRLTQRCVAWREVEIRDWIGARIAASRKDAA